MHGAHEELQVPRKITYSEVMELRDWAFLDLSGACQGHKRP